MPTIRGYKEGINDKALRDLVDRYTSHVASIATKVGKKAMYEIRSSAVKTWYNSTSHWAMNLATIYEAEDPKQSNNKIEITIKSYVDINKFEEYKMAASERNWFKSPYESVKKWRERHEKDGWRYYGKERVHMYKDNPNRLGTYQPSRPAINMHYSIGEYLFNLPWQEGIIGLPSEERYTDTGWVNPAKNIEREMSLRDYLKKRFEKEWGKKVNDHFNELLNKK